MHQRYGELLSNAGFATERVGSSTAAGSTSDANGQNLLITEVQRATQQIQQLETITQSNVDTVTANTDAITQSATSHSTSSSSVSGTLQQAASSVLGGGGILGGLLGGFGLGSLISGIAGLFGGGSPAPTPLVQYQAPPTQNFAEAIGNGTTGQAVDDAYGNPRVSSFTDMALGGIDNRGTPSDAGSNGRSSQVTGQSTQHITVQVNAMDSQSFLDRSGDIANAVRNAMLNMHSINDVVNDL